MKRIRSKYKIVKTLLLLNCLSKKLDLILISEFPKSGGTWFSQLISDLVNIPYHRHNIPPLSKGVIHGHYLYNNNFDKMFYIVRDGRDVMVSAYHHFLLGFKNQPSFVKSKYRKKMPFENYEDIKGNMPEFIRFMFEDYPKKNFKFSWFSWSEGIEHHLNNSNVMFVKYEEMHKTPTAQLAKALSFLDRPAQSEIELQKTVDKFSFKKQTDRKQGEEDKKSFLRKGIVGDWKNYFTKESAEVFNKYAGEQLITMGYEEDLNWPKSL